MTRFAYLLLALTAATAFAADSEIIPADVLAKKWKRTKSLAAPVEKIRKGLEVETGAPAPAKPVEVKVDADTAAAFQNIQFAKDSAELLPGVTMSQLAEIAKALQMAGSEKFLVEGHTCDLGGDAHNLALSQRRALAVKSELIRLGVDSARLQVIGFGESDPLVPNTDESARAKNRRVQVYRKL